MTKVAAPNKKRPTALLATPADPSHGPSSHPDGGVAVLGVVAVVVVATSYESMELYMRSGCESPCSKAVLLGAQAADSSRSNPIDVQRAAARVRELFIAGALLQAERSLGMVMKSISEQV